MAVLPASPKLTMSTWQLSTPPEWPVLEKLPTSSRNGDRFFSLGAAVGARVRSAVPPSNARFSFYRQNECTQLAFRSASNQTIGCGRTSVKRRSCATWRSCPPPRTCNCTVERSFANMARIAGRRGAGCRANPKDRGSLDVPPSAELESGSGSGNQEQNREGDRRVETRRDETGFWYETFVMTRDQKLAKLRKESAEGGRVRTSFNNAFAYTSWIDVHRVLLERNLQSVPPEEALRMSQTGEAVLLDVREAPDFAKFHAEGAVNAPLYRLIEGNSFQANMRRLGHALLTDFAGTERNPRFAEQALAAVGGNTSQKVIIMCSRGGSLKTVVERKGSKPKTYKDPMLAFGIQSRSLKACYELQESGFTSVLHLEGGLSNWSHLDLPTAGTSV